MTPSIPSYCLSLPRRKERRAAAAREFAAAGLEVEFVEALDMGREHAELSCRMGHWRMLRLAQAAGSDRSLIFEDDVVLCDGFVGKMRALDFPGDWGMILLGCVRRGEPRAALERPDWFSGTHAYLVNGSRLSTVIDRLAASREAADVGYNRLGDACPVYALRENLAWQRDGASDIQVGDQRRYGASGEQLKPYLPS